MTECQYVKPIETFDHGFRPEKWFEVDVIGKGRKALEEVNLNLGMYQIICSLNVERLLSILLKHILMMCTELGIKNPKRERERENICV